MNCQEAILRLPWWLNGSLEPAEQREIREHLAACPACREALGETRLAWEIFDQHIPTAALVAYAADDPPEGLDRIDPALLERHLADCPQCAAELEMARASRLLSEHGEVPLLGPRRAEPARRERGWQAAAIAAGLTGVIALGGLFTSVQKVHRLEESLGAAPGLRVGAGGAGGVSKPAIAVGTALGDLYPAGGAVARGEAEGAVAVQKSAGHATLTLHPSAIDPYREHSFEILTASGESLGGEHPLLPRNPDNYYSLDFDLASLAPGDYVIQVFGLTDTAGPARKPLDRFPFTVR